MDDVILCEVLEPLIHLVNEFASLSLFHGSFGSDAGLHIPAITELCYDVAVVSACEDLHTV
jgi:hypothetical protein